MSCSDDQASAADFTFASALPLVAIVNVESKTALESHICQYPTGSNIRKKTRRKVMLEVGHS
jgi:hypothetical protein